MQGKYIAWDVLKPLLEEATHVINHQRRFQTELGVLCKEI